MVRTSISNSGSWSEVSHTHSEADLPSSMATETEATAIAGSAITTHEAKTNPHSQYLLSAGGTDLSIQSVDPTVVLNSTGNLTTTGYPALRFQHNGLDRWTIYAVGAEGISEEGADLHFVTYMDDGQQNMTPVIIDRSSGRVSLIGPPILSAHAATKQYVDMPPFWFGRYTGSFSVPNNADTSIPITNIDSYGPVWVMSGNDVVIPVIGWYTITASLTSAAFWTVAGTPVRATLSIKATASPNIVNSCSFSYLQDSATFTTQMFLAPGNKVQVLLNQQSGSAKLVSSASLTLSLTYTY